MCVIKKQVSNGKSHPAIRVTLSTSGCCNVLSRTSENDLSDIFKIRHPDSRWFTWQRKTSFLQRRLDYFLVSDSLQESIEMIDIIPSVASNHSAIIFKLRSTYEGNQGNSYWKFNSSLTEDRQFVNSLKNKTPLFEKEAFYLTHPIMKWEFLKFKFREFTGSFSIQKSKGKKARQCEFGKKAGRVRMLTFNWP